MHEATDLSLFGHFKDTRGCAQSLTVGTEVFNMTEMIAVSERWHWIQSLSESQYKLTVYTQESHFWDSETSFILSWKTFIHHLLHMQSFLCLVLLLTELSAYVSSVQQISDSLWKSSVFFNQIDAYQLLSSKQTGETVC